MHELLRCTGIGFLIILTGITGAVTMLLAGYLVGEYVEYCKKSKTAMIIGIVLLVILVSAALGFVLCHTQ